jgi:hypothetical protein
LQEANALFVDEDYDSALDLYNQAITKAPEVIEPAASSSKFFSHLADVIFQHNLETEQVAPRTLKNTPPNIQSLA